MPCRILLIDFYPVINGTASFVMGVYRHMDRTRFQFDFLISTSYKKYHHHLDEIRHLGGRIFYFDYNRENFFGERIGQLRTFLTSHPEIRGIHIHDTRWQTDPLVLADELGLPIKVTQCHTAKSRSISHSPIMDPDILRRIRQIEGPQYIRLACSDLAGIYGYQGLSYEVMPNGIDLKKYIYHPLYRELIRGKLDISSDCCVIGYIANDSRIKNTAKALHVFREFHKLIPDSKLLLVGSQYNNPFFLRELKSLDCKDSVLHLHAPEMMELLYSAMDMVLMTSFSEGLPFSMVEAQATGLPCLISDEVSSMICLTDLAEQFSLKKTDADWAQKMLRMLEQRGERASQSDAIRDAGYDIRQVTEKLMDIYQKCLDDSPAN